MPDTDLKDWWNRTTARIHADWNAARARRSQQPAQQSATPRSSASATRGPIRALKWGGSIFGALIVVLILVLIFMPWNWLRGPISRYASHRLHRQVTIAGNLNVHLFSWTPRADVGSIRIANTKWAGGGDMADVGHLAVSVKLMPLFRWRLIMPLVAVENASLLLVRDANGRANWQFNTSESHKPLKLPAIQRFLIDGHIKIVDAKRKLTFLGQVESSDSTTQRGTGFQLAGQGSLNRSPFSAEVHGAPLLNVDVSKPYPFTADVQAGSTHLVARGDILHPFDMGGIDSAMTVTGHDAADLYYLTGLVMPDTPPYRASLHIVRDGEVYRVTDLSGMMGQTDLSGTMTIDASGERLFAHGELASRHVYLRDLGFLFGSGRALAAAPASTRKAAASAPGITLAGAKSVAQSTLLLPDAPLDVERVRQMDADVVYRARSVVSRDLPLRSIAVHARLNDGLLRLDPLHATLAQGTISGAVKLDARKRIPVTSIDLRARDIRLQDLLSNIQGQPPLEGTLDARAILTGAGNTVHRAASNASGSLTFVVPHGLMRKAFAELLGINLLNGGIALLTGDQSQTTMRCAVAHFTAANGVFTARDIVLDTDVELGTGKGDVDMRNETVNLEFTGDAKHLRLMRLNAPILITGSLSHPKVGVEAVKALGQGGLVVGLASLVSPLAAVLPLIDVGMAKDANCGGLMSEARAHGAPLGKRAMLQATPVGDRTTRH
jgi:hypothetical protein